MDRRLLLRCLSLTAALLTCAPLPAQGDAPERKVEANRITSQHDPSLRIDLPRQVHYIGADRWVLYDLADCELHIFVEADAHNKVKRLYWLQFEAYLPTRPELHHTYPFAQTAKLDGMDFDLRARFGPTGEVSQPGSDLEHVQKLLHTAGYTLPPDMMNVRLVHLLDDQKRKELMFIYMEDLAPTGFTTADLLPGGKHSDQWPAIEKPLIQRAEATITFHKLTEH